MIIQVYKARSDHRTIVIDKKIFTQIVVVFLYDDIQVHVKTAKSIQCYGA